MIRSPFTHFQYITCAALLSLSVACGSSSTPPADPSAEVANSTPDPRYKQLPQPTAPPDWKLPALRTVTLENGLRLWHFEQKSAPLVSVQLILPQGAAGDPAQQEGLTSLTVDLLDEGAGKLSALELSEELGLLATDYQTQVGLDFVLFSLDALAENLEPSLQLLSDILRAPHLQADEFQRRREHHRAQAIARQSQPMSLLRESYHQVLFGGGYASRSTDGSEQSLSRLQLADVKRRFQQLSVPAGAELVLVGALSFEQAQEYTQRLFGEWKGKAAEPSFPVEEPPALSQIHVTHLEGAAQSALAVVTRAGNFREPNYFPELVMNRSLGESFTGRINLNLREEKGYTYGAYSSFRRYRHAGLFGVVSHVVTEATAASVQEILKEFQELCSSRPLTPTEHQNAQEGLLLGFPLRFETTHDISYQIASLPLQGRPVDFWQTWPDQVRAVSLEQAQAAAQPYCDPQRYQIVIVGDLAAIRLSLEELGLPLQERPRSTTATPSHQTQLD